MSTKRVISKETESPGFKRVTDAMEARRLIERAIESRAPVDVRMTPSEKRFTSQVHESSNAKNGLVFQCPTDQLPEGSAQRDSECMVIIFLKGQVLLCIRATNAVWKGDLLQLPAPWDVFKHQRRKEPRFEIPSAYVLHVTIEDPTETSRKLRKKLIDLSASGMSFELEAPQEAEIFKPGLFLHQMIIVLDAKEVRLDGQIRNVLPVIEGKPGSGLKVGVQFVRVNSDYARYITAYVARHLAQFSV